MRRLVKDQFDSWMADKVFVVTGAGRGIGREIALQAAQQGALVVVNDLGGSADGVGADKHPAEEVVAEITGAGGEAVADTESVADASGAERLIEHALDAFGRLDVVINNAGILRDRIFHKMDRADWDAVIGVHLMGSFYVSRAAAPHFRKQEHGAYVHFTSTSGLIGNLGQANYAAAKLGIVGLSKSIALDMEAFHVRSNCIAPFAWSRLVQSIPEGVDKDRVDRIRSMGADKVAPLAIFLGSEHAASITGQIFAVRKNEIFLMSQSRPLRSIHRAEGWTQKDLAEQMLPALAPSFYALERSADVFAWDPI